MGFILTDCISCLLCHQCYIQPQHFLNTGRCLKTACSYLHTTSPRQTVVQERHARRLLEHEARAGAGVVIQSSSQRAAVTATWLMDTFSLLPGHNTVLDVAGGRGDLGFELAAKLGLDCLTVDPRPAKLKRWQARYLKKNPDAVRPRHLQDRHGVSTFKRNMVRTEMSPV